MSALRARYDNDVALFSLQTVPLSLMRFSAPVKKHWLGSFSIVPLSGLRGTAGARGRKVGGLWGGGGGWGG